MITYLQVPERKLTETSSWWAFKLNHGKCLSERSGLHTGYVCACENDAYMRQKNSLLFHEHSTDYFPIDVSETFAILPFELTVHEILLTQSFL